MQRASLLSIFASFCTQLTFETLSWLTFAGKCRESVIYDGDALHMCVPCSCRGPSALTSNCLMRLPLFLRAAINNSFRMFSKTKRNYSGVSSLCSRRAARGGARRSLPPQQSSLHLVKWKFIVGSLSWILKAIEHHTIEHYWVENFNDINFMFSLLCVMD